VNNSTTGHLRSADRTLTSTTSSLLLERLTTSTRNFAAALDLVRTLAGSSKLSNNDLVDQGNVDGDIKEVCRKINRSSLLTLEVDNVESGYGSHES
jgi:uncharacterized protein (UPF0333 family)